MIFCLIDNLKNHFLFFILVLMDAGKLELAFFDLPLDFAYFASVVVLLAFAPCKFVKDGFALTLGFKELFPLFLLETLSFSDWSSLLD